MKEMFKSATEMHGDLFVMTTGTLKIVMWFVGNWDSNHMVISIATNANIFVLQ